MMQHRIEEHPDFESTIQNDPIELLKAIKICYAISHQSEIPLCITKRGADENIEHQAVGTRKSY